MTRAEKQSLMQWLGEIADKLDASEADAEAAALADVAQRGGEWRDRFPFAFGWLGATTREQARSIRAAIRAHLEPRKRVA